MHRKRPENREKKIVCDYWQALCTHQYDSKVFRLLLPIDATIMNKSVSFQWPLAHRYFYTSSLYYYLLYFLLCSFFIIILLYSIHHFDLFALNKYVFHDSSTNHLNIISPIIDSMFSNVFICAYKCVLKNIISTAPRASFLCHSVYFIIFLLTLDRRYRSRYQQKKKNKAKQNKNVKCYQKVTSVSLLLFFWFFFRFLILFFFLLFFFWLAFFILDKRYVNNSL